jgi:hypothetical protein
MINTKNHPKYWALHKEIYFNELDSLDAEIMNMILNKPSSSTAFRFNSKIDRLVQERIKETDNQLQ